MFKFHSHTVTLRQWTILNANFNINNFLCIVIRDDINNFFSRYLYFFIWFHIFDWCIYKRYWNRLNYPSDFRPCWPHESFNYSLNALRTYLHKFIEHKPEIQCYHITIYFTYIVHTNQTRNNNQNIPLKSNLTFTKKIYIIKFSRIKPKF